MTASTRLKDEHPRDGRDRHVELAEDLRERERDDRRVGERERYRDAEQRCPHGSDRLAESGREHLDQGDRARGIGGEGAEELFARDRDAADRPLRVDVRDATTAWVEHLDLADQLAHAENDRAARALDAHRTLEHEQEPAPRLADPHDGVAVLELARLAQREDRIEELRGSIENTRGSRTSRS